MSTLTVEAGLDLPALPDDDRLNAVLAAALARRTRPIEAGPRAPWWDASFFGLERVSVFRDASAERQQAVVERCSRALLEEAFYIEKLGIVYAAKMVLLAPSVEERMLYGLFAGDEATHFERVRRWLDGCEARPGRFHRLLASVGEEADRDTMVFVVQVVLEGWGIRHYRAMADACVEAPLREILLNIVDDETRHHGSGVLLSRRARWSSDTRQAILDLLTPFLQAVRAGPQGVLEALSVELGPLDVQQRVQVLRELDTETHSRVRLDLLGSLMTGEMAEPVRDELARRGLFEPLPPEACT